MENYNIVRELHKGDLSSTLRVTRKDCNDQFAVKKISELVRANMSLLEKEVQPLLSLNHPNLIRYLDYFIEERHLFLVMELAKGGDLFGRLDSLRRKARRENFHLSEGEILSVFVPILQALSYLEQQNIFHGSISPKTIFFTEGGTVKLGDFGFSKVKKTTMETVTRSNKYYDSILYMSPEFYKYGKRTHKNDVYAAGCILYELMMLKHPFDGSLYRDLKDTVNKVEIPVIPAGVYSKDLTSLVEAMLAFDEDERTSATKAIDQPFIKSFLFSLRED